MTNPKLEFKVTFVVAKESFEKTYDDHKKASNFQLALLQDGIEATLKASKVA